MCVYAHTHKFGGHTYSICKFLGQELNLSHSYDLCHSCDNTGSLTHCSRPEMEPMVPQTQRQIVNLLHHSRNSSFSYFS